MYDRGEKYLYSAIPVSKDIKISEAYRYLKKYLFSN